MVIKVDDWEIKVSEERWVYSQFSYGDANPQGV